MNNRKHIMLLSQAEDQIITIMKPTSSEHNDKYIVIDETAYGDVELYLMTPEAICNNFAISEDKLFEFIDTLKNN